MHGVFMINKSRLSTYLLGVLLSSATLAANDLAVQIEIRSNWQRRQVNHLVDFWKAPRLANGKELRLLNALGTNIFEPARIISLEPEQSSKGAHYGILYTPDAWADNIPMTRAFESGQSRVYMTWRGETKTFSDSILKGMDFLSKDVGVLDLSGSRLRKTYYPVIETLSGIEYLAFPIGGIDLDDPTITPPPNVKELILYNTRITDKGLLKLQGLANLQRLVFDDCWFDGDVVLPRINPNFTAYGAPVRQGPLKATGFERLCSHLRKMELIDCDERLAVMMLYHVWDNLEELSLDVEPDPDYGSLLLLDYFAPSRTKNSNLFPKLSLLKLSIVTKDSPDLIRKLVERRLGSDWTLKLDVTMRAHSAEPNPGQE